MHPWSKTKQSVSNVEQTDNGRPAGRPCLCFANKCCFTLLTAQHKACQQKCWMWFKTVYFNWTMLKHRTCDSSLCWCDNFLFIGDYFILWDRFKTRCRVKKIFWFFFTPIKASKGSTVISFSLSLNSLVIVISCPIWTNIFPFFTFPTRISGPFVSSKMARGICKFSLYLSLFIR